MQHNSCVSASNLDPSLALACKRHILIVEGLWNVVAITRRLGRWSSSSYSAALLVG
jgi:hypothetical protein